MFERLEQVFPIEMFDEICTYIANNPPSYDDNGWKSNRSMFHGHSNRDFAKANALNCIDVSENLDSLVLDAWKYLQEKYFPDTDLLRCYVNGHTYGQDGYPHTDSIRAGDKTIVIYLNRAWRKEWGGETLLYRGDHIEHAELPKENHGLVFEGAQLHCARGVTRACSRQRLTLMFKFAPKGIDLLRQKLQAFLTEHGCNKITHSRRTLMAHLLGVYDILRQSGQPDHVCAAGGLHSIFGTNSFKSRAIGFEQADAVASVFGKDAVYLAQLFCTLARPRTLESAMANQGITLELSTFGTVTVGHQVRDELCQIETANLVEQGFKKWERFPCLESLSEKFIKKQK